LALFPLHRTRELSFDSGDFSAAGKIFSYELLPGALKLL
jgi:hypothetical protein